MKFFDEKLNKIPVGYIYSVILFAIIIILFISTYGNIYNAHSDIGREFYIPSQMLKGQVLYKDIFNIFPPLGYFINAFFLKIFGDNVNTFYFIGLVLSIFILVPLYKLTKKYCDSLTAFLVTLTIVITCMFYPSLSNWITPYSYSVLYSLASIVWAIYFLDKYIDDENYKNIIYVIVFIFPVSLFLLVPFKLSTLVLVTILEILFSIFNSKGPLFLFFNLTLLSCDVDLIT